MSFYSNRKRRRSNSQGSSMFWSWSMLFLIVHSFFGGQNGRIMKFVEEGFFLRCFFLKDIFGDRRYDLM